MSARRHAPEDGAAQAAGAVGPAVLAAGDGGADAPRRVVVPDPPADGSPGPPVRMRHRARGTVVTVPAAAAGRLWTAGWDPVGP